MGETRFYRAAHVPSRLMARACLGLANLDVVALCARAGKTGAKNGGKMGGEGGPPRSRARGARLEEEALAEVEKIERELRRGRFAPTALRTASAVLRPLRSLCAEWRSAANSRSQLYSPHRSAGSL